MPHQTITCPCYDTTVFGHTWPCQQAAKPHPEARPLSNATQLLNEMTVTLTNMEQTYGDLQTSIREVEAALAEFERRHATDRSTRTRR